MNEQKKSSTAVKNFFKNIPTRTSLNHANYPTVPE